MRNKIEQDRQARIIRLDQKDRADTYRAGPQVSPRSIDLRDWLVHSAHELQQIERLLAKRLDQSQPGFK